ncbi:hypothetical protein CF54_04060 [Streptomyces sp. Tu 6176]|uniref:hypothetical protein n=1 Tax=Streptomyces sp. Tu 6176 TaxID=1470557 RepID=UPI0004467A3E|nr:hypothetical protein [Streptomyces sp. Tu 6176]EYT83992.1 hypothetical protein CF54_04060 [Streptomyces sp. Tu 6176]
MATTAQQLVAFHKELKAAGLDHDLVRDMVRDASQTLVMSVGLTVTTPADKSEGEGMVGTDLTA